jgi:hypothetical protein
VTLGQLVMDLRAIMSEYGSALPVLVVRGDRVIGVAPDVEQIEEVRVEEASRDISGEWVLGDGHAVAVIEVRP